MEATVRNAVHHYLTFCLRPGPFWKLPPSLERLLIEGARAAFGASWWDDPLQRERLDHSFAALAQAERTRQAPSYDDDMLLAVTFGHLPLHFPKVAELLCTLWLGHDFPKTLRVLDLGCGPGTAALSAQYFFALLGAAQGLFGAERPRYQLDLVLADRSKAALDMAKRLVASFSPGRDAVRTTLKDQVQVDFTAEAQPTDAKLGAEPYDLILLQNYFGELRQLSVAKRKDMIVKLGGWLKPNGALLLVEGSSQGRVQEFHQIVSKALETGGLNLFAPCPSLLGKPQGVRCYSCTGSVHRGLVRPRILEYVCRASQQYGFDELNAGNIWTSAIVRRLPGSVCPAALPGMAEVLSLSSLVEAEPPARASVVVTVAAQDPSNPCLYKVCDQSCGAEACLLDLPAGQVSCALECGDVLSVTGARVEKRVDAEEGTVRVLLHVDKDASVANLTRADRGVTWRQAVEGAQGLV